MKKWFKITSIVLICTIWFVLAVISWFKPADKLSVSERRPFMQFPSLSAQTIENASFMRDFEKYTTDQFPFRDSFRRLKALFSKNILLQKDNNKVYIANGHASKLDYPASETSMQNAVNKITELYNLSCTGSHANVYFSIVPDKNYFLAEENGYLSMDYAEFAEYFRDNLGFADYIDIFDTLSIDDYYTTDSHWKQECLQETVNKLADSMGLVLSDVYEEQTLSNTFYGVYYGQAALPLSPDTLKILTNKALEQCSVYSVENGSTTGVYNWEKLNGNDPYDVFLSGAAPILVLENPNAKTDRELIMFRDSYGSSIAPLLAEGYSKITLIDTRYIVPEYIGQFVDFSSADDVLFLYCTTLLNSSSTLK